MADGDEWFAGVFTNAAIEQPVLDDSDLLIGIGLDPVELIPRAWSAGNPSSPAIPGAWKTRTCRLPSNMSLPSRNAWALIENGLLGVRLE